MTRRSVDLKIATHPDWVQVVLADFDEFLVDHAACERKASALAMSLVAKHPDADAIIPTLIQVAREELDHFDEVYRLLRRRGLSLAPDIRDPYVAELNRHVRHGRDSHFLDRLLVSSVIECRGAERFGIIAGALEDPDLAAFYQQLYRAETKHGHQFADLALRLFPADVVYPRLEALMCIEAEIIQRLEWRASLH